MLMPFNRISPLGRVVQAAEKLNKGGFAAAVFPYDRQTAADPELHADMTQRVLTGAGIAEGHVPKLHMILAIGALFRRERP